MSYWPTEQESLLEWAWLQEKRRTGVAPPPTEFQKRQRIENLKGRIRWKRFQKIAFAPPLDDDDLYPVGDHWRRLHETGFHIEGRAA